MSGAMGKKNVNPFANSKRKSDVLVDPFNGYNWT
jgi:hypothetical protein